MAGDNFVWSIALGDRDTYLLIFEDRDREPVDMTGKAEIQVELKLLEADVAPTIVKSSLNAGEIDLVVGTTNQYIVTFEPADIVTAKGFAARKRYPLYVSSRDSVGWTTHSSGTMAVTQGRSHPAT